MFKNYYKYILYTFLFTPIGSLLANVSTKLFIKPLVKISKNIDIKNKPFYIILTIDTESGLTEKSEKRLWQVDNPDLFEGYYYGIKNWLKLLNKHKIKATFLLSSQCFSAKGNNRILIKKELSKLIQHCHELGYHLHPRSDHALEKEIGKYLKYTSSKFYSENEIDIMLQSARKLLIKNFGEKINNKIVSFRWGNFGLQNHAIKPLTNNGFMIDSSAIPNIKKHIHDDMYCDWKYINYSMPFKFKNTNLLEIPITTFSILNKIFAVEFIYNTILFNVLNKYRSVNNKTRVPIFFVILSHSSEATYINSQPTKIIKAAEKFIKYSKQYRNISFITLKEAYDIYQKYEQANTNK